MSQLKPVISQFIYYKKLADTTIERLTNDQFFWQFNHTSNSIAIIVKHISGNMLSRWTDFLTTDGEKASRRREQEFEIEGEDKKAMLLNWEKAWEVFIDTLESLSDEQLNDIVYIRNQGHTVLEAINRQLSHYPYHIGQIVQLGKMIMDDNWVSLSIPKGKSGEFNAKKFEEKRQRKHFLDND